MSRQNRSIPWRKIAVTGAAGHIGGETARRLHELGCSLVLLDQRPPVNLPHASKQIDLRDPDAVLRALEGVDAVCHLGEVPNILPGMTGQEVFDMNTAICRTMLDAAREQGVRQFIYTSSCQRYGYWGSSQFPTERLPEVWPIDERQPPIGLNLYAESKIFNEQQCLAASESMRVFVYRFPWVLRLHPGDRLQRHWQRADDYLFEGFWTYLALEDAAESFVCGLDPTGPDSGQLSNFEAFHFLADEIVGDLATSEKLKRFLPAWPKLPEDWPSHQPPVSCARAQRMLGWRPQYRMSAVIRSEAEQTGT